MDCQTCQDHLLAYAWGELSPEEASQVEAALAHCPDCRAELHAITVMREALDEEPLAPLAPFRRALVLEEAARVSRERRRAARAGWFSWAGLAVTAGGLGAMALTITWVMQSRVPDAAAPEIVSPTAATAPASPALETIARNDEAAAAEPAAVVAPPAAPAPLEIGEEGANAPAAAPLAAEAVAAEAEAEVAEAAAAPPPAVEPPSVDVAARSATPRQESAADQRTRPSAPSVRSSVASTRPSGGSIVSSSGVASPARQSRDAAQGGATTTVREEFAAPVDSDRARSAQAAPEPYGTGGFGRQQAASDVLALDEAAAVGAARGAGVDLPPAPMAAAPAPTADLPPAPMAAAPVRPSPAPPAEAPGAPALQPSRDAETESRASNTASIGQRARTTANESEGLAPMAAPAPTADLAVADRPAEQAPAMSGALADDAAAAAPAGAPQREMQERAADGQALLAAGLLAYDEGRYREAADAMRAAAATGDAQTVGEARFWLAASLVELNRPEDALRQLREFLRLHPGHRREPDARTLLDRLAPRDAAPAPMRNQASEPR